MTVFGDERPLNDLNWTKNASFREKVLISIIKSLIEHNITDTDLFLVDGGYDHGSTAVQSGRSVVP